MTTATQTPRLEENRERGSHSLQRLVGRQFGESHCLNADCMEVMREYPDSFFDLAICDPPYGVNAGATKKYLSLIHI